MDLETQSAIDLRKMGSRAYLRSPTTRLMSAVFMADDEIVVWSPLSRMPRGIAGDAFWLNVAKALPERWPSFAIDVDEEVPQRVCGWIREGRTFIAHNAEGFDAIAWERFCPGQQPDWYDTVHAARACGLPASLDKCSQALGGPGKDDSGKRAMQLLCRAKVSGEDVVYPVGTQAVWEMMLRYNVQDVIELKRIYEGTRVQEPEVLAAHCAVNARGIPVNREFARRLKDLWSKLGRLSKDRVAEITGGRLREDDLASPAKVKRWLAEVGFEVKSLERKQVEAIIADPDGFFGDADDKRVQTVIEVVRIRHQSVRAAAGKVDRVFTSADGDDRIRGCFVYCGASTTGRWSGKELQPHNFPRGLADLELARLLADPTLEAVIDVAGQSRVGDALGTLMRPVVCAGPGCLLPVVDLSRVEACAAAFVAQDPNLLGALSDERRDVYCEMASSIFGHPVSKEDELKRFVGKQTVLGCQYGMGANKFGAQAKLQGCDLSKAGVTPEECVKAYRTRYPMVKAGWRALDQAFRHAIDGHEAAACCCTFYRRGDDVRMRYPSGREIVYRGARTEPIIPVWGGAPLPTPCYTAPHGYRKTVYGGMLMDHVCQGMCRDILARCLVQFQDHAVMHVHDEVVCEIEEEDALDLLARMLEFMSTPPPWADGFPLSCEGFITKHYVKKCLPGFAHGKGIGGKAWIAS